VQRDWLESCFGARNCDELASSFSCKFLVQVLGSSFWYELLKHVSLALTLSLWFRFLRLRQSSLASQRSTSVTF